MKDSIEIKLNSVEDIKKFNLEAMSFEDGIDVFRERNVIDAKSLMGLFSMDLSKPVTAKIMSNDEKVCDDFMNVMSKYEILN